MPCRCERDRGAVRERQAFPVDNLRRVVELAVHAPGHLIEAAADERVVEGEPPPVLRVHGVGLQGGEREKAEVDQGAIRIPFRLDARVIPFRGRPPHVAGAGGEDELGQDLRSDHVLRVGGGAGVVGRFDGSPVANLAPAVRAHEERPLQPFAAAGQRQVPAGVVGAAVPGHLGADMEVASAQVVRGILCE